jgi:hypothetical protein
MFMGQIQVTISDETERWLNEWAEKEFSNLKDSQGIVVERALNHYRRSLERDRELLEDNQNNMS